MLLEKTDETDERVYFYEEIMTFKGFRDEYYRKCKDYCRQLEKYQGKGYLRVVDMGLFASDRDNS